MKALHDKTELKQRNTAYKVTLECCPETCNDVDKAFNVMLNNLINSCIVDELRTEALTLALNTLCNDIKDVGTRKLRQAFVDYVLDSTKDKE